VKTPRQQGLAGMAAPGAGQMPPASLRAQPGTAPPGGRGCARLACFRNVLHVSETAGAPRARASLRTAFGKTLIFFMKTSSEHEAFQGGARACRQGLPARQERVAWAPGWLDGVRAEERHEIKKLS